MFLQTLIGQLFKQSDGAQANLRGGNLGELITQELHGRYYEQVYRKNMFFAANQAAQAVSVALATTYTGLVVSNPAGSTVNMVLNKIGIALSAAPAAIAPIGLITGYNAAGIVTHTTPLTPQSANIGSGANCAGKADAAATLVGTPAWSLPLMSGFTAAALPSAGPQVIDVEGIIVIPPGGFAAIGALTAVTGLFSMFWEEVPV
jgi:hypothetical protein